MSNSGAGGGTAMASTGAAGTAPVPVIDPSSAGMSGEPPFVVNPVETWGGKPLGMVPYATSGTRLAAVGYADEGAVFFDTMRDAQLGADCTFEQNEAGDWLCSPTKKQTLIYLDAACTQPAVEAPAYSTPTGVVFGFLGTSSLGSGGSDTVLVPNHWPVYRVAEEVFASDGTTTFAEDTLSIYTGANGGQCTGPREANRHVVVAPPSIFRVTPVADSELVKATVRHVPLKDDLTLERLVTEDGAQLSGHLELAGKECELERDGHCVPAPVALGAGFADPDCTEYTFKLPDGAQASAPVYGVESTADDTTKIYELSPTTTVYSEMTRTDIQIQDGQETPVIITECVSLDVSNASIVYYRRAREVTDELPKLYTVQLGSADLFPIWFFGVLSASDTPIQAQIHSPEGSWVRPNIRTSDGSVCAVYDDRYVDKCLMYDGLSSLPVTEVNL